MPCLPGARLEAMPRATRGPMNPIFVRLLTWCLALTVLVVGCELRPLPGGIPGPRFDGVSQTIPFIVGTLVDGSGQPVEGATVRAYVAPYSIEGLSPEAMAAVETTTDARGGFKLDSPPLGSVAVEARGRGLKALRTGVAVAMGATVELGTLALQPTGRLSGKVVAAGLASLLGTDVFVPGTDYHAMTADDGSYVIHDVPVGVYYLAAMRSSFRPRVLGGIQVVAGQTTVAPDLELSLDAPVLSSLHPESGGPGTVVTLRGENFGASKHTSLQVTFNDTLATTVRRVSDTEIQATVPVGATTGGVVVRSNGIASQARPFQVIARLSLTPSSAGLYPGEEFTFGYQALNERGERILDPFVTWALRDPSIGTVSAQGSFRGQGEGTSELQIRSGVLAASAWVGITPYRLDTLYGNGQDVAAGDGMTAAAAAIPGPTAMTSDAAGNLYVLSGASRVIRRIAPDGVITHFAGNGTSQLVEGVPARESGLGDFSRMAIGADNRLWLADGHREVLRFIPLDDRASPEFRAGHIYRAAGTGVAGYSGSGLPGAQSALNDPAGLCPRPDGVYFADTTNHRLRRLAPDGRVWDVLGQGNPGFLSAPTPEGSVSLNRPFNMAQDTKGNWVIGCKEQLVFWCRVPGTYFGRAMLAGVVYPLLTLDVNRAFAGDGLLERTFLLSDYPGGFVLDGQGACWFTDGQLIRRITAEGRLETVAGSPLGAAINRLLGYSGDGVNALAGNLGSVGDLLAVGDRLLVADLSYHRIRVLSLPAR